MHSGYLTMRCICISTYLGFADWGGFDYTPEGVLRKQFLQDKLKGFVILSPANRTWVPPVSSKSDMARLEYTEHAPEGVTTSFGGELCTGFDDNIHVSYKPKLPNKPINSPIGNPVDSFNPPSDEKDSEKPSVSSLFNADLPSDDSASSSSAPSSSPLPPSTEQPPPSPSSSSSSSQPSVSCKSDETESGMKTTEPTGPVPMPVILAFVSYFVTKGKEQSDNPLFEIEHISTHPSAKRLGLATLLVKAVHREVNIHLVVSLVETYMFDFVNIYTLYYIYLY